MEKNQNFLDSSTNFETSFFYFVGAFSILSRDCDAYLHEVFLIMYEYGRDCLQKHGLDDEYLNGKMRFLAHYIGESFACLVLLLVGAYADVIYISFDDDDDDDDLPLLH